MNKARRGFLMRRTFGVLSLLAFVALAGAVAFPRQQTQQPPPPTTSPSAGIQQGTPIQKRVAEVDMILSVVNRRQKFIVDLEKTDFRVLEDNHEQKIEFFSRQIDLPLRLGLLMDTSNSIRPRLQFEKEAATNFVSNTLRKDRDQMFVMTFDSEPQVVINYTNDAEKLRNTIDAQRAGGGTALYDAMLKASDMLANAPPPKTGSPEVHRVLVVISDGDDNLSSHTKSDAIDALGRAGVQVYTISTSTQWITPEESNDPSKKFDRKWGKTDGDLILEKFALETGGRPFFPYHVDDVLQGFEDISVELRSQYLLGYIPVNSVTDGKFRKVKIEVLGHKELEVRTRKGYYAVAPAAASSGSPVGN
jgi:Ca-activated chloride channel family protein